MSDPEPACVECGAELAPDQEYCLECGARQTVARPGWRRPLIAAGIAVLLSAAVFAFAYARMSDDADREAARHDAKVTRSEASAGAGGSENGKPAPAVRLAAQPSP